MKITLPRKVLMIINNLQLHGYEAFAVGGCVRDSILARRPEDWDITTSAKPEEIKKLFRRTVDTGIEHGTVTVLIGKDSFEVTTYGLTGRTKMEDIRRRCVLPAVWRRICRDGILQSMPWHTMTRCVWLTYLEECRISTII